MGEGDTPAFGDFSSVATKKAVLHSTLQHPITMYSTGVGVLGTLAVGLFGPALIPAAAAVAGFGVGVGSWAVNYYLRGDHFADQHVRELRDRLKAYEEEILKKLEADLIELRYIPFGEKVAAQGGEQYVSVREKFENLKSILASKLNANEVTFTRYLGTAEQVYLSVLDNLLVLVTTCKSVSTIDEDYARDRISQLKSQGGSSDADKQEMNALQDRLKLLDDQMQKVRMLLTNNEIAMTELDKASAAIADMRTTRGKASVDLATAMKDLEDLVKRAGKYSIGA